MEIDDLEHLQRWMETMSDRPAVQRGLEVPVAVDLDDDEVSTDEAEEYGRQLVED